MTEYWVSTAKFYCKYCNQWIVDTKSSKDTHNSGEKHKMRVEAFNRNKRKESLHGASNEKDLSIQMAAIEKAARLAMHEDRIATGAWNVSNGGMEYAANEFSGENTESFVMNSALVVNNEPQRSGGLDLSAVQLSEEANRMIADNLRNKSGVYTIKGQNYLEGEIHFSRINELTRCQVFVEAEDEWIPVDHVDINANTSSTSSLSMDIMPSFTVTYTLSSGDIVTECSVRADRIRLLANKDGTVMFKKIKAELESSVVPTDEYDSTEQALSRNEKYVPSIVESTGLGGWSVVSEREVSDQEVKVLEEETRKSGRKRQSYGDEGSKGVSLSTSNLVWDTDDALTSYDPYGKNKYKGMDLAPRDEIIHDEAYDLAKGVSVQFKKRKACDQTSDGGGVRQVRSFRTRTE